MRRQLLVLLAIGSSSVAHADPKRIDAVMSDWARQDGPGCAVAVIQSGKVTHAKGYGMADLERRVPIGPETVFDIGSTSKQFTAAAILMLAADGKLKLDDDIRKYLPELPALGKQPITIRHLLHHTGGLRDYMGLLQLGGKQIADVTTAKETVAALARQKGVEFEPGTKHRYSNTGYFVLAQIVERASKLSMARFAEERIWKPLGMSRTLVYDDHTRLVPNRAIGYAPKPPGWQLDMSQWEQTGDGAVFTTVLDLAKWDANFYEPKLGGKALVAALQEPGKLADGKVLDYAAGLFLGTYRGQATVSHSGGWAGYRAQLERFPKLGTSVAVLCNAANANPVKLARKIADVVLEKQLAPAEPPAATPATAGAAAGAAAIQLTTAELDAWAGKYRNTTTGEVVLISRKGDALSVEARGQTFALTPTSKTAGKLPVGELVLELAGAAPRRKLAFRSKHVDEQHEEVTPYTPAAAELAGYAGRYFSPELEAMWTLSIKDGVLRANGPGLEGDVLAPSLKDELALVASGMVLKFTRGARGVTGFVVSGGGVRGLRFEKLP